MKLGEIENLMTLANNLMKAGDALRQVCGQIVEMEVGLPEGSDDLKAVQDMKMSTVRYLERIATKLRVDHSEGSKAFKATYPWRSDGN